MLIDTHVHLQDKKYQDDLEQVLERAEQEGVETMICIGYDYQSSKAAVKLSEKYSSVYAVVGIHPHDARSYTAEIGSQLFTLAKKAKVLAVGEMGLDFYRDLSPRDTQKKVFIEQIKIAQELKKPIVVHDRDAHSEVLEIIKKEKAGKNQGIMHCYSGHWPLASELMGLGFYISFAGPITYKNAKKSQEVLAKMTLERLLIETDCPYLSPEPKRGQRNEPAQLTYVAAKVAQIRNKSIEEIGYITSRNAHKAFAF